MGNACCNYQTGPGGKDPHALEDGANGKPIKMDPKVRDEILREVKKNEGKIVKIQAVWRGHNARKRMKNDDHINQRPRASARRSNRPPNNGGAIARQLNEMPDYSNSATRATEQKLGKFEYNLPASPSSKNLIERGPYELDNGAIYVGEWTKEGLRHGKGLQIWKDGSKYEGYWKSDMANGKGRLIHSDGDVYEGEWLNDKAHGKGTYIHMDGAKYTGEWREDK